MAEQEIPGTMAQQAHAFRTSSDQDYADLVNGRITLAELVAKNMPDDSDRAVTRG